MKGIKAFTLAELLIALAVIGVLAAILMPIVFNIIPDQNALMAKRAYFSTQTVVSELINDDSCYPDQTYVINPRIGFEDGYGYVNCEKWGGNAETEQYINTEGSPVMKFATLFADSLDVKKGTYSADSGNKGATFTTKDGMVYKIFPVKQNSADKIGISVDVNGLGTSNKPNCGQSKVSMAEPGTILNLNSSAQTNSSTSCTNLKSGHDKFGMVIDYDGTISIEDSWARKAVEINNDTSGASTGGYQY